MEQGQSTFEVRIKDCRFHTWQGELVTEDGKIVVFRSERELLVTIDKLLCKDPDTTGRRHALRSDSKRT